MSDDWAVTAAKKLKDQLESRRQSDAMLLQQQAWRQEQGPKLWNQVRQLMRTRCEGLNKEFDRQVAYLQVETSSHIHVVFLVPGFDRRELHANFSATNATDALNWGTSGHITGNPRSYQYELAIANGKVFLQNNLMEAYTPEEMAEKMLNALLVE